MNFTPLPIPGAFLIEPTPHADERGFFARTWCVREFEAHGLDPGLVQCSISVNRRRGTLRGMHYQRPPGEENKLVRCTRGAVYDVILDLRPDSSTYARWHATELTDANYSAVYIPKGVAHGFQTLVDDAELLYQMSDFHQPSLAAGIRWNDPRFGIRWPLTDDFPISARDRDYPLFSQ
jgi:dTDP-4-dehydrorhamnose 3,5-epimerase